jgi:hypothetical protein
MKSQVKAMPRKVDPRMGLAIAVLVLSTWTFARLLARYDVHWTVFLLWSSLTGTAVGALLASGRGCLVGTAVGLAVGLLLIPLDVFLWLTFTLPPHPKVDL